MRLILRNTLLLLSAAGLLLGQRAMPKKAAPVKKPAAPAVADTRTAYNKSALETYVRHLFVWGDQIRVDIADPVPSTRLPGFNEISVRASAGQASQEEVFLVSKDGKQIVKGNVFDVTQNPFLPEIAKLKTLFQPSFGTPGATVVVVFFADFQCPACRQEAKMIREKLVGAFPTQVRVYFKDYPLVSLHPWAKAASIAGRCVFRQKPAAFWDFYDWIYDRQSDFTPDNLKSKVMDWAKTKDLDVLQLGRCIDARETEAEVDQNMADGKSLNINATPTMFVNGRRLVGNVEWVNLRQIIEYEIAYQKTAKNAGEDCGCSLELPSPLK